MSSICHRRIGRINRGSRTYLVELLVKVLQLRALAHTLLRIQGKHAMGQGGVEHVCAALFQWPHLAHEEGRLHRCEAPSHEKGERVVD
jgi:hypothetical protein